MHVKYAVLHCSYSAPVRVSTIAAEVSSIAARACTALRAVRGLGAGDWGLVRRAETDVVALRAETLGVAVRPYDVVALRAETVGAVAARPITVARAAGVAARDIAPARTDVSRGAASAKDHDPATNKNATINFLIP